ncbi:MAG TPA: histidine kinase dimerization/phospho-acceptor domain-containing protein, partial [Candidatus Baltobacteraceae bacterium]|nr:histidine kinase dimerization/phospho-acceptor domain-containing protein [Candidatus Baltobacteraceae bacterium]
MMRPNGHVPGMEAGMTGMTPFRQNLRLLLRAGVPAAGVLVALVGIVLWRIAVLERASAAEDRADQSVVMAASLAGDFVRMQNDARAALLMRDVRHSRQRELAARVEVRFARLPSLLTEERYRAQVRDIRATYLRWQARTAPAALLRSHKESAPFTAADLRLTLSESLLTKADELVQALRGSRMEASHANEDAARSAVFMSIGGTIVLLLVLAGSIFWSLAEAQREAQQRWQLERQNEQIRELARVKSEFVTHMSHELRTPLTGIMGMAEVLRDDKAGPVTPRQKHYLTDILASSNHLLDLINRVLDLAKAEAGKIS